MYIYSVFKGITKKNPMKCNLGISPVVSKLVLCAELIHQIHKQEYKLNVCWWGKRSLYMHFQKNTNFLFN